MEMDRLSALPDSLRLHILHYLSLEEAAKTAVLAKQWRFLWTNLPFEFTERSEKIEEIQSFVTRVHAALAVRRGPALNHLSVRFSYDKRFAANVDSWLDFAAKNKVKELSLYLNQRGCFDQRHRYTLPQFMYSNSSLVHLTLDNGTIVPPQAAVEWRCLKSLALWEVKVPQQAIEEIVSGCPLLETLKLVCCDGYNRLEIGGRSFRSLSVSHFCEDLLEISAPYMLDLCLIFESMVRIDNVPSLESAHIGFYAGDWDSISAEEVKQITIKLFQDLGHVEVLELSESWTEGLSIMGTNGWLVPQCRVKYLDMYMRDSEDVGGIYGVLAMLESSPYVEKLLIYEAAPYANVEELMESIYWGPITRDDLSCDLLHLKTVSFSYLDISGKATSTLARILLKRAPLLENMVIHNSRFLSTEEIDLTKQKLLNYPKSFHKISIEISVDNV